MPGDKPGTVLIEDYAIAAIPHAPFLLDKLLLQDAIKTPPRRICTSRPVRCSDGGRG